MTMLPLALNGIAVATLLAASALTWRENVSRDLILRSQRETLTHQANQLAAERAEAVAQAQMILTLKDHLRVVVAAYKLAAQAKQLDR